MIKANELRIGNLAQDATGKIIVVKSVHESGGINFYSWSDTHHGVVSGGADYEYSLDQIYPAPLTEERLERLGLEYIEENDFDRPAHINVFNGVRFSVFVRFGQFSVVIGSTEKILIEIDYIHQLQNIVHALTGTELTIKQ